MLLTVTQWINTSFGEGSRPAKSTVIQWLSNGKLNGFKIGGKWYIDDDFKACVPSPDQPEASDTDLDFSFLYDSPN